MCLHAAEAAVKTESEDATMPKKNKSKKDKGKRKQTEVREDTGSTPAVPKRPPLVSIAAIVGGMSTQKQHRILDRGVDILVATPGRLWDILEEVGDILLVKISFYIFLTQDDDLAKQIKSLKFLVLDEADRMIEAGHFAELEHILRLTLRRSRFVFPFDTIKG
jgi:ATP-dependent RNA helicase DDX24/MAK5